MSTLTFLPSRANTTANAIRRASLEYTYRKTPLQNQPNQHPNFWSYIKKTAPLLSRSWTLFTTWWTVPKKYQVWPRLCTVSRTERHDGWKLGPIVRRRLSLPLRATLDSALSLSLARVLCMQTCSLLRFFLPRKRWRMCVILEAISRAFLLTNTIELGVLAAYIRLEETRGGSRQELLHQVSRYLSPAFAVLRHVSCISIGPVYCAAVFYFMICCSELPEFDLIIWEPAALCHFEILT